MTFYKLLKAFYHKIRCCLIPSVDDFPCLASHLCKFHFINNLKLNVDTLIFGSSHMEQGFAPKENEFNFSITSQDLYYSWNMYKIANNKNIQNVIISFSDFSSWHSIIGSRYFIYAAYYEAFCNIPPEKGKNSNILLRRLKRISEREKSNQNFNDYKGEFLYYGNKLYQENKAESLKWATKYNNYFYSKNHKALQYLLSFLEETKKNNQNLIIVITPIIDKYFKVISLSENVLFAELNNMIKDFNHVKLLNYRNSKQFNNQDFSDWEHLNFKGAQKLSALIRKEL